MIQAFTSHIFKYIFRGIFALGLLLSTSPVLFSQGTHQDSLFGLEIIVDSIGDPISEYKLISPLPSIQIIDFRGQYFAGAQNSSIGADQLKYIQGVTLSDLLLKLPGGFVKSYGSGSLGTASIQGSSANQAQVTWMGIPVNSPSLGLTDLSLFPAELLQFVQVETGANTVENGSGGLGGVIKVGAFNRALFRLNPRASVSLGAGSFGRYDASGMVHLTKGRFGSESRFVYRNAENNYPYRDLTRFGTPDTTLSHAAFQQVGFSQNLGFAINDFNTVFLNLWALNSHREIPPIMGAPATEEQQHDRNLRAAISMENKLRIGKLSTTASVFDDLNDYQNPTYNIRGLNHFNSYVIQSEYDSFEPIGYKKKSIMGYLRFRNDQAQTDGWEGTRQRNTTSAYLRYNWFRFKRLKTSIGVLQEIVDGKFTPVLPVAGIEYRAIKEQRKFIPTLTLNGNFGRNFRMPTLNDLYWTPGGNQDLAPEKSWKGQLGSSAFFHHYRNEKVELYSLDVLTFASHVKDWILWQPTGFGYWEAQNVQEVFSRGFSVSFSAQTGGFNAFRKSDYPTKTEWNVNLQYSFTRSQSIPGGSGIFSGTGSQLIYVPQHVLNGGFSLQFKRFDIACNPSFTGSRYITTDLSQELDPYVLLDFSAGIRLGEGQQRFKLSLNVENALNTEYQAVAARPMAGRALMLRLDWMNLSPNYKKN